MIQGASLPFPIEPELKTRFSESIAFIFPDFLRKEIPQSFLYFQRARNHSSVPPFSGCLCSPQVQFVGFYGSKPMNH